MELHNRYPEAAASFARAENLRSWECDMWNAHASVEDASDDPDNQPPSELEPYDYRDCDI